MHFQKITGKVRQGQGRGYYLVKTDQLTLCALLLDRRSLPHMEGATNWRVLQVRKSA
jgi:hypothetical protein